MSPQMKEAIEAWPTFSKILSVPSKDKEYKKLVALLDQLTDKVGEDEKNPLASLMETISIIIEAYEQNHTKEYAGDPVSSLKLLMKEHGLYQKDLHEIGSQGVVSEILNGKRKLNIKQIEALSKRFSVSPSVFIS